MKCHDFLSLIANSGDPDEIPQYMQHFIWVFTVANYLCKSIQNENGYFYIVGT